MEKSLTENPSSFILAYKGNGVHSLQLETQKKRSSFTPTWQTNEKEIVYSTCSTITELNMSHPAIIVNIGVSPSTQYLSPLCSTHVLKDASVPDRLGSDKQDPFHHPEWDLRSHMYTPWSRRLHLQTTSSYVRLVSAARRRVLVTCRLTCRHSRLPCSSQTFRRCPGPSRDHIRYRQSIWGEEARQVHRNGYTRVEVWNPEYPSSNLLDHCSFSHSRNRLLRRCYSPCPIHREQNQRGRI